MKLSTELRKTKTNSFINFMEIVKVFLVEDIFPSE